MIGSRTPFRMSFIGGGSDLKEFYSKSKGCVISTTINKYMYIFIHPFFDERIQIKYSKTELVSDLKDIKHPIVRAALDKFKLKGIDINSIADIPAGTGLGSSSAFTVGLLNALYAITNQQVSEELLAREACIIEIDILKEPIGKQDQYSVAFGGFNLINFYPDGKVKVDPIVMKKKIIKQLQNNLLLFYTGKTRSASDVLINQKKNIVSAQDKFDTQVQMTELVKEAKNTLVESNLEEFGKIMDLNWNLKKSLSHKISNSEIDDIYNLGKNNGALGGKILGAGGGGFILFYCEPKNQKRLCFSLKKLKRLNFSFENTGSSILKLS